MRGEATPLAEKPGDAPSASHAIEEINALECRQERQEFGVGQFERAHPVSCYRGPTVNAAAPALNPWERAVTWILPGCPSLARTISIAFP